MFSQKFFMRCYTWNLTCNGIKDQALKERQDAVVEHLFKQSPQSWFKEYAYDTYMEYWDGSKKGYILQNTTFRISKKANILGPLAAVFGRQLEYKIATLNEWKEHRGNYPDKFIVEVSQTEFS